MSSGVALSDIKGNAPDDQKQMCIGVLDFYATLGDHFAFTVGKRLKLSEVSVGEVVNGKGRAEVVCEIGLEQGWFFYGSRTSVKLIRRPQTWSIYLELYTEVVLRKSVFILSIDQTSNHTFSQLFDRCVG